MTLHKLAYISLSILLIGFIFFIAVTIFPYLLPFIIALILAVLIEPVVELTQKLLKLERKWASPIIFSLFMIIFLGLLYLLIAKVIVEFLALVERLPRIIEGMTPVLNQWFEDLQQLYLLIPYDVISSITTSMQELINWIQQFAKAVGGTILNIAAGLPGFLIVTLIVIISFALLSYQLPNLKKGFLSIFEEKTQEKVKIILKDLNNALVGFVRAQIIISMMTYVLALIGLWILGIKYALAISLIIVVVDILPILGTGSVIIPWALYQLIISGNQFVGIGLIVLYIVITIFRRIVEPKILGENIGLSTITVIISMYVGFKIFGILGLFLGPVLFILFKAMRKAGMFEKKIEF